ncbi:Terminase small subunit [compost metagenome]
MGKVKLTIKQEQFCREFIKDFNATGAAIRAGYSAKTAYSIGSENLTKPEIQARIADLLDKQEMNEGEIKKRISDIARTDMANYLVKRKVPYTPLVKVGLAEVIKERRDYVLREEIFCERMGLTEKEFDKFQSDLNITRESILRMEIELESNPNAYRIVEGETVMIDQVDFDLVKLAEDKERGVIKSFIHTKDGIQVETYSADNALVTLAKFKGMLVDKSEVDLNANVDTTVRVGYGDSGTD